MPALSTLEDLFVKELRDVYDAERQITKALPKMIKASASDDLTEALQQHLVVTKGQIERLDQVFHQLDMRPRGTHCAGMAGLIEEGSHLIEEDPEEPVLDAGLIGAAQKVEHYEIAAYGTLATFARQLGHAEAADLLEQTLSEEKETDQRLTQIAEAHINQQAQMAQGESEGEEEEGTGTMRRGRTSGTGGRTSAGTRRASSTSRSGSGRTVTSSSRRSGSAPTTRRSTASDRGARRR
jgi:ferritin-like metal-binding protein YciE